MGGENIRVLYIYPIDTVGDINKALDAGNKLQSQLQQIFDDVSIITEYDYSGNIIANYIKNIQKIHESDLIVLKQSKSLSRYTDLFKNLLEITGEKFLQERAD